MATYNRLPVIFTKGEGCWLWDDQGNKYLDAVAGVAVCSLGHAHPGIAETISRQAQRLLHTSNLYEIENQRLLGEKLAELSKMESAFFCNSGAEANEAAIKIARLYGHGKGIDEPAIIVMEDSFHGRTIATLSATGNRKVQAGFEPLLTGFVRAPYGYIDMLEKIAKQYKNIVAVLVEPVQGEAGVNIPPEGYLRALRLLCDKHDWLLMLDEIQTGCCRTGKFFAFQYEDLLPDVLTLAKALGNGVPIGCCLGRGDAARLFKPGNHGSTYGGNPFSCAVGLAVIEEMEATNLAEAAFDLGKRISKALNKQLEGIKGVIEIRNKGAMIAIELDRPCAELVNRALKKGLLINVTADKRIRLLPPLIMNETESQQLVETLSPLIKEFLAGSTG